MLFKFLKIWTSLDPLLAGFDVFFAIQDTLSGLLRCAGDVYVIKIDRLFCSSV